jgi:DNA repair photolyase
MASQPARWHVTTVTRTIDALVADLIEPILRARPSEAQWRLIGWDAEQGIQVTLGRGDDVLLVELEAIDAALPCYARTARFNVCARRAFQADRPLGSDERRVVDQFVALIRSRERRLPLLEQTGAVAPSGPGAPRDKPGAERAEVREVHVDRLLVPEGRGHYYINPYVGCMIGCPFCYVAERAGLSRALDGATPLPWGRYVDVKVNAAEVLRREVREHPPGIVRMSPILTDPYQPLERRYRITRGCLEVLLEAGYSPVLLTRAARVQDDIDLLARFPSAAVGISIPTDDDRVRSHFEPRADAIEARIEALAAVHAAGVRTCAVIQPVLPMIAGRLVDLLSPLVRAVRIDRMHRMDRALALYAAGGYAHAATDEFFDSTVVALRAGFSARGVAVDDLDDLAGALS